MNQWQRRISSAFGIAALALALLAGSGSMAFARGGHGGHHGGYHHRGGGYHHRGGGYHRGGRYFRGYGGLNSYRGGYGLGGLGYRYLYPRYRVRRPFYAPYVYPTPYYYRPWYGGGFR